MANSDFDDYFMAIGRLSTAWALVEHCLDMCVSNIFHTRGGSSIEREIPRTAKQKMKFFRRAFTTLPELSKSQNLAIKIADHFSSTLQMRVWCVHGFAENAFSGGLPEIFKLTRLALPDFDAFEEKHITLKDIEQCYSESTELLVALCFVLHEPLNVIPEKHFEDVLSRFGIEAAVVRAALQDYA